MEVELKKTNDGSFTLYNEALDEHYHSIHGAFQESMHVFVKNGLENCNPVNRCINVFEVGFGTGLNFLLAANFAIENNLSLNYISLEPFPVSDSIIKQDIYGIPLNKPNINAQFINLYQEIIKGETIAFTENINVQVLAIPLQKFTTTFKANVVFYDAFSPTSSPEMWELETLSNAVNVLKLGGSLVTYCAKGYVRRNFIELGMIAERLPGPPGKREMLRITKPI